MPTHHRYDAFWSYTRFDDEHDGQWLTDLKKALQAEVQALSGVNVEIFQDVDGIAWGERWKTKIKTSADDATFLIPIITPSYFKSETCRLELEQFVEREKSTGFGEFILPVYYIECSELRDKFIKGTDRLAQIVADHNYRDIRPYRHWSLDSYEARQEVKKLATGLIERLNGFAQFHLSSDKIEARITAPASHARVPREAIILGTLREISDFVEVWVVVETGNAYHPQAHLPRGSVAWQARVIIGGAQVGLDADREFTIHVLAVTAETNNAFERYRADYGKIKKWPGVPKPPNSRILATLRLVRDDSVSIFAFMTGVYDEWFDGAPTGGTISMKLTTGETFATEAKNRSGTTEWTGNVKMNKFIDQVVGNGTYCYVGKTDSGEHHLTIDPVTGDIKIEGRSASHLAGKSFQTVWKKRL